MRIQHLMELTHFVVGDVSISQAKGDGIYESYVIGEDGVWILIILLMSNTQMVNQGPCPRNMSGDSHTIWQATNTEWNWPNLLPALAPENFGLSAPSEGFRARKTKS